MSYQSDNNGYYGTFAQTWTPPKQDVYTIIATFEGDASYGSSSAATSISIEPATATATPTATTTQAIGVTMSDFATYFIIGIIAIIIAIAVVGALILRKRA